MSAHQEPRLPADRRGSLGIVDLVRARTEGGFYDPDSDDVLVTPEDELVVKLALAIKAALGSPVVPTGWSPTKEAPSARIYSRQVSLSLPSTTEVGGLAQLLGADPDRRAARLWTANVGGVLVGQDRYAVQSGLVALLPPNVVLNLNYAGPIWVGGPAGTAAAFNVYAIAEASEVRNVPRLGSLAADAHGDEAGGA